MTTMPAKKMFKVLCPMESRSGHKWWMRMGSAFMNKDDSINLYLDALPFKAGSTLQLRELTEEDIRIANERRAAFHLPRPGHGVTSGAAGPVDHVHVAARHDDGGSGGPVGAGAPMPPPLDGDFPHLGDPFTPSSVPF